MISTILVEHPWLTTVALVGLVVLGPIVGRWLATRRTLAYGCALLSLLPVVLLTLVPTDREVFARCAVEWSVPTLGAVELVANIVLFVPPVLLAGVASGRPLRALLAGSVLSLVIEAVQAGVPALGRSCSTNDWLDNTIGSCLGATLAAIALLWHRRSAG